MSKIPEGLTRQPDRDNNPDFPEENSWEYVTDDGYRVCRITGSSYPWLVFPPPGYRHPRGSFQPSSCVPNLTRAVAAIERYRLAER